VQLEAMTAAAAAGRKDHDRWLMKRNLLARKLATRRATSKLPALLDFVLTRPIVSAGMIAAELKITPRAAQNLVVALGLREATGRGRYRAWAIPFGSMDCLLANGRDGTGYRVARRCHKTDVGLWLSVVDRDNCQQVGSMGRIGHRSR
jgi:hypothetical protein